MLHNRQSSIVETTLRALLSRNRTGNVAGKTVLAFLFHHMNGMDEGLETLKVLHEKRIRVRVCADPKIFEHYHVADLAKQIGFNDWISLKELDSQKEQFDQFYLPVLPFSVVSDLLAFRDRHGPIRIILWALMRGKDVSAFSSGANPYDRIWRDAGLDQGTALMKREMMQQLNRIKGYGIQLIGNQADVLKHFSTIFDKETKQVITAAVVEKQAAAGQRSISIETGMIMTPLARDLARKYKIEVKDLRGEGTYGTGNRSW